MSKRRTIASIDTAIADIQKRLVSLEKRKTKLSDKLNELQKERDLRQAEEIFVAFRESGKSYRQLMTFLGK